MLIDELTLPQASGAIQAEERNACMKPVLAHVQQYFIHSLLLKQILPLFQWKTVTTAQFSIVFQVPRERCTKILLKGWTLSA